MFTYANVCSRGILSPFSCSPPQVIPLRGPIRQEQLDRLAGGLTVLGLITIALGTVAIAAPLLFSLVIEQFLGVLFVLGERPNALSLNQWPGAHILT